MKKPSTLLKIGEAARILGIHIDTLRRWEKSGKLSSIRTPGGTRLYSLDSLQKLIPRQEEPPPIPEAPLSTEKLLQKADNSLDPLDLSSFKVYLDPATPVEAEIKKSFLSKAITPALSFFSFTLIITTLAVIGYLNNPSMFDQFFQKAEIKTIPQSVLAALTGPTFLEINSDTQINGALAINGSLNNLVVEATPSANTFELISGDSVLSVTNSATIDQDVSTTGSPTFTALTSGTLTNTGTSTLTGVVSLGNLLNLGSLATDPTTGSNGQTYYNTSNNKFRCYQNGAWKDCDTDTDTTNSGDITGVTAGNGLTGGGSSGDVTVSLDVTTTSTTTTTSANSGLEATSAGLSLLRGCANEEVLLWNAADALWACGEGGGNIAVQEGDTTVVAEAASFDFLGGDFDISETPADEEANISLAAVLTSVTGVAGDFSVAGGDITTSQTTATLFNSTATTLSIGGAATTFNIGPTGSGAGSILLAGGSADTGCTINQASGALTCTGDISSGSGTVGAWTRSDPYVYPATITDSVGIGTTTPVAPLEIDPQAFTTTSTTQAVVFIDNANLITTNTGNSNVFSLAIDEPNILVGSATPGNAASLYVSGAPTEASSGNFALWVDNGESRFENIPVAGSTTGSALTIVPSYIVEAADLTLSGIRIALDTNSNTDSGDTAYGLNIDDITSAAGPTEYGLRVGSGYDYLMLFELGTRDLRIAATEPSAGTSPLTLTIPAIAANDDFCVKTLANCTGAGGGSGVTFTGQTTDAITKFTDNAGEITSAGLTDDGNTFTFSANRAITMTAGTGTITQNFSPTGSTSAARALTITPTFGIDATDQTLTGIYINPNTNSNTDADDVLYGIFTGTTASSAYEIGLAIHSGYDTALDIQNNSSTTNIATILAQSLTTGSALSIEGPELTAGVISGASSGFVRIASDVGSAGTTGNLLYLAPDFSATSTTTGVGLRVAATDSTTAGNIDYGIYSTVTLTGNADTYAAGVYSVVTSSSTTPDFLNGGIFQSNATGNAARTDNFGVIASALSSSTTADSLSAIKATTAKSGDTQSGTQYNYGIYSVPSTTGPSTGTTAVTNVYGLYSSITATHAADAGTVNGYGLYVANGTMSTNGTSTKYGLYVETPTGADTNYAAYFAGGNVNVQALSASSAVYTDASKNLTSTAPTSGALGYWSRSDTTLSPTTAGDNLSISATTDITTPSGEALTLSPGGTGAFQVTTSTGAQTYTSSVVTGTTTTSAFVFDATAITTGTGMYLTSDSITQGKLAQIATTGNTLTTGTLLDVRTTATSLTGAAGIGSLMNLDWTPGSSTTATGDLFALNIGANGTTTGNLFNILDSSSSIFSVSEVQFTTSLPSNFTAAGDVSIAYDIAFTNQTASFIKSSAPLTIEAGETFESNDITLKTYNQGSVVFDSSMTTGNVIELNNTTLTSGILFNITTGSAWTGEILSYDDPSNSAWTGNVFDVDTGTGNVSGNVIDINLEATTNNDAQAIVVASADENDQPGWLMELNSTAAFTASAIDLDSTAAFTGAMIHMDNSGNTAWTGHLIDVETGTGNYTGNVLDVFLEASANNDGQVIVVINDDESDQPGWFENIDSQAAFTSSMFQFDSTTNDAWTGNLWDIDTGTGNVSGNIIDVNFEATTNNDAQFLVLANADESDQAGWLASITASAAWTANAFNFVQSAGISTADVIAYDNSGNTATTGDFLSFASGTGDADGDVFDITVELGATSTQIFDVNNAALSDEAGWLLEVDTTGAWVGNMVDITTGANIWTANMFDINVGAAAATGDIFNIDLGATAPAVQALVVTTTSSTATDGVIDLNVSTGAGQSTDVIDITSTLGIMDGSDVFQAMDINITGADHTGSNTITGIDLSLTTPDAEATETAINISANWDTDINATTDLEIGIGGTDEIILTSTAFSPAADAGSALGTTTLAWNGLHLNTGTAINWENGDVTLTHSADALAIAGGDVTLTGHFLPGTDDTYTLGDDTHRWQDIYLGPASIHIGTSTTDEGTITYDTTANTLNFSTDATTNGDIAFFTDDLYIDKATGFVGIGDATPSFNLEVAGTLNITGDVSCGSGCTAGPWVRTVTTVGFANAGDSLGLDLGAGAQSLITATAAPTADMFAITNTGQGTTTTAIDGISLVFVTGDGADPTNSGINIALTSGGGAAGDVLNGINFALTGTSGTEKGINFADNNFDIDINATTNLTLGIGGTNEIILTATNFTPGGDGLNSLGASGTEWNDLFLDTGAVINFEASNVTLTHTSGTLTLAGTLSATDLTCSNCLAAGDLGTDSVAADEIATGAVTTAEILLDTILAEDIAAGAVGQSEIGSAAVGTDELKTSTGSTTCAANTQCVVTGQDYSFALSMTDTGSTPHCTTPHISTADPEDTIMRYRLSPNSCPSVQSNGTHTGRWRYITASDHPTIWFIVNADGNITQTVWEADDPINPAKYPENPNPLEGSQLRDGQYFYSPEVISLSNLKLLFSKFPQEDQDTVISELRTYVVDKRGWLTSLNTLDDLANIETRYNPSGREWAFRYLVKHYQQSTPLAISLFLKLDNDKNLVPVDDPIGALNTYNAEVAAMWAEAAAEQAAQDALPINTQNADFAEWYSKASGEVIEAGDLVSIGQYGTVTKASSPYDQKVLGIMSTSPYMTAGKKVNEDDIQLALSGRVPTKVSTENGNIEVGDYLTTSSIPGVAMKAIRPGPTVGKALQEFNGEGGEACPSNNPDQTSSLSCGKILVFVNISFADPGNFFANLSFDEEGNLIIPKIKTGSLVVDTSVLSTSPDLEEEQQYYDLTGKIASLEERIKNAELRIKNFEATGSAEIAGVSEASSSASESASLADNSTLDILNSELTPPDILIATGSAVIANLKVTSEATFSGKLVAYEAEIQDNFKVLGQTTLSNTLIAGDFTVDGTLSLTGSSINSIDTLYIQNSPLSSLVDFFNGKVTINNEGLLSIEKLAISSQTLATDTIPAGQTTILIPSDQITSNSKIFITAHKPVLISVTNKDISSKNFTVELASPQLTDITFDWWIVDSKELSSN